MIFKILEVINQLMKNKAEYQKNLRNYRTYYK